MTERDEDTADKRGTKVTDVAIGEPTAGDRHCIDGHRVKAVDRGCFGGGESESARRRWGDHEEDEQSAHPVVAEALPHLGEEEDGEASRMAQPFVAHAATLPIDTSERCQFVTSGRTAARTVRVRSFLLLDFHEL